ncbi:MAG: lmo0937 family membrane protein [Gemmatimonas sp.]
MLIVACVLFVLWLLGVTIFKMTRGLIHLVLIIAIIAIVLHFVRGL